MESLPEMSLALAGRIIVLFVWARLANALTYFSATNNEAAFFPLLASKEFPMVLICFAFAKRKLGRFQIFFIKEQRFRHEHTIRNRHYRQRFT